LSKPAVEAFSVEGGKLAVPEPDARGVYSFKGIPYAQPPVGPLRWRPPLPPLPWEGERSAERFGSNALQGVVFDDIDPFAVGVSEDCLYLNVWTPALGDETPVPVMFWIHGGASVVGSGAEPRYDGTNLAARGIVVVTVNHRLNALGFMAHPELTTEPPAGASGNYGMLDLVAALGWVKRNIRAFGGDPDEVTVAGESAGAKAVCGLMASPLARGLFHRAIAESGSLFPSPTVAPASLAEAEEAGLAFMRKAGAASLAELRALPAEAILDAAPGPAFRTMVDGHFLPRPPEAIFADGEQSAVPLLAGWNRDEGFNFALAPYPERVRELFGARADAALGLYPEGRAGGRALGGDLAVGHPLWAWLEAHRATARSPVYRFRFDRAPLVVGRDGTSSRDAGAFHACEIVYVFDNLQASPWKVEAEDREAAALASAYWVNFVKTGDPNGAGLPAWPSYRRDDDPLMLLDATAQAVSDPDRDRHALLADVVRGG
jgi:para-nitrobenzyl esterase